MPTGLWETLTPERQRELMQELWMQPSILEQVVSARAVSAAFRDLHQQHWRTPFAVNGEHDWRRFPRAGTIENGRFVPAPRRGTDIAFVFERGLPDLLVEVHPIETLLGRSCYALQRESGLAKYVRAVEIHSRVYHTLLFEQRGNGIEYIYRDGTKRCYGTFLGFEVNITDG